MECKHKFNNSSIAAAKKSRRPERARIPCVKCDEAVLLIDIKVIKNVLLEDKKKSDKKEEKECQPTDTIASRLPTES